METFCDINVFTVIFIILYIEFRPTVKKKITFKVKCILLLSFSSEGLINNKHDLTGIDSLHSFLHF